MITDLAIKKVKDELLEKKLKMIENELLKNKDTLEILIEAKKNELMIPYSHIGSGKFFGEIALQINKENPTKKITRAATIVCLTQCKFAIMSKTDY